MEMRDRLTTRLKWRLVPAPRRAEMLYKASEILIARKEEYAQLMTREMGKVIKETRGDTQEAIDTAYYMAGEGRRLFGPTTPSELPNKFAMAIRQPPSPAVAPKKEIVRRTSSTAICCRSTPFSLGVRSRTRRSPCARAAIRRATGCCGSTASDVAI